MFAHDSWKRYSCCVGILMLFMLLSPMRDAQAEEGNDWIRIGETFLGREMSAFVDGDAVYVSHMESPSGKLSVRKLENGVWSQVGPATLTPSNAYTTSLYVYNGVPYVAYYESYHEAYGVSVIEYDAVSDQWDYVGPRAFTGVGSFSDITLAIDEGELYVSYQSFRSSTKYGAYVMKYDPDKDDWEHLGGDKPLDRSFDTNKITMQVIDGNVFVNRYRGIDYDNERYIVIDKFDDTVPDGEWTTLTAYTPAWDLPDGSSIFGMRVDQNTIYNAHVNFYGETIVKQAGGNWQTIGTLGNRVMYGYSYAARPAIQFYAGMMYVAYSSIVDDVFHLAVDRFDGNEWETLGSPIAAQNSETYFENVSIDIDQGKLTLSFLERGKGASRGEINVYTYMDEFSLEIPPALTADSRERGIGDEVILTFDNDDPQWVDRHVRLTAGGRTLYRNQDYTIGDGVITINPGVLNAGFQTITVQAEGYVGATVVQKIMPQPPQSVAVSATGDSFAQVAWSEVAGADAYNIYVGKTPDVRHAPDVQTISVNAAVKPLAWIIPKLDNGETYYFAITSLADGLESAASDEVQAVPAPKTDEVAKPWRLVGDSFPGISPSFALDDGILYTAYREEGAVTVLKHIDGEWQPVGSRMFTVGNAYDPAIDVYQGIPYVAYQTTSGQAAVVKLENGDWVPAGKVPPSSGQATRASVVVHDGVPYVAYIADAAGGAANSAGTLRVKRLVVEGERAGEWESVGDLDGYQSVRSDSIRVQVDGDRLLVSFTEASNGKLHLLEWDTTAELTGWQPIEPAEELAQARVIAMAAQGGDVYVARTFIGTDASRRLDIWMWDSSAGAWSDLGGGFAGYEAALDVDRGIPYIAYIDQREAVVQKYVNGRWYQVGSKVYPQGTEVYDLDLVVEGDLPYVIYYNNGYTVEVRTQHYEEWCAVTLDHRVEGSEPATVTLPCGEPLPEPEPLVLRPNYYFVHWSADGVEPYDFTRRIEAPITLLAVWNLPAPGNVAVDDYDDAQITLTWDAVPGATGYRVYRSTDEAAAGTAVWSGADTTFNDAGLVNGTAYYYAVTAIDGEVESELSDAVTGTPRTTPQAPRNVAAEAIAGTRASLTFAKPDDGGSAITGYKVAVLPDADSGLDGYELDSLPVPESPEAEQVRLEVDGLSVNVGYAFRVAAVNGEGASDWSDETEQVVPRYVCAYRLYMKDGSDAVPLTQPCLEPLEHDRVRTGFVFGGWYLDEAFAVPFVPSDANRDTELPVYARWMRTGEPLPENEWHVIDHMADRKLNLSAVIHDGALYQAYWDDGYLSVRKYADGAWEQLGERQFARIADEMTVIHSQHAALVVEHDTVYVAFSDDESAMALMKFGPSDEEWQAVTQQSFADGLVDNLALAVRDGKPYVAYVDLMTFTPRVRQWVDGAEDGHWREVDTVTLAPPGAFVYSMSFQADGSKLYLACSYFDLASGRMSVRVVERNDSDPSAEWVPIGDLTALSASDTAAHLYSKVTLLVQGGVPTVSLRRDSADYTSADILVLRFVDDEWVKLGERQWAQTDTHLFELDDFSAAMDGSVPYVLYHDYRQNKTDFSGESSFAVENVYASPRMVGDPIQPAFVSLFRPQLLKSGNRLFAVYASREVDFDVESGDYVYKDQTIVQSLTLPVCRVTFDSRNGTAAATEEVVCGEPVTAPASDPQRPNYEFAGWYEDEAFVAPYDFREPVTADMPLYAKWQIAIPDAPADLSVQGAGDGFVTLAWTAEPLASDYRVYVGTSADAITAPAATVTDTVYTVLGLTNGMTYYFTVTAVNESGESDFAVPVSATPERGVCAVSFDSRGGSAVETVFVLCGDAAAKPAPDPTRNDDVFAGWYADEALSAAYEFDSPVTSSITLYAKWRRAVPAAPSDLAVREVGDGYVLIGWTAVPNATGYRVYVGVSEDVYGASAVTVTDTVYAATGLANEATYYFTVTAENESGESEFAAWVSATPGVPVCTVRFDSTGGSAVAPLLVPCGDRAAMPQPDPVREGYTFAGWYADERYEQRYEFGAAVNADLWLYARWERSPQPGNGDGNEDGGGSGGNGEEPANVDDSVPDSADAPPADDGRANVDIRINGEREAAGKLAIAEQEGRIVATMTIDVGLLERRLAGDAVQGRLELPFELPADSVLGVLTGDLVKMLELRDMTVAIRTDAVIYEIPAAELQVDRLAERMGDRVRLEDLEIRIEVSRSEADVRRIADELAAAERIDIVTSPIRFTITVRYEDRETEVAAFSRMVARMLLIPDDVDPGRITTAVVIEEDGRVRHVPTRIVVVDGRYYAQISSLTNSDYTLISNAVAFEDVERHWSGDVVNEMGSRLIVAGYGDGRFHPDRAVTRGEFAMMVAKALGLHTGEEDAGFADMAPDDVFGGAVRSAHARGLINGYADGTFRPSDHITREQAMAIVARALALAGTDEAMRTSEPGAADPLARFADRNQVAEWAREAVSTAVQSGIANGKAESVLAPRDEITRAESAVMIYRMLLAAGWI